MPPLPDKTVLTYVAKLAPKHDAQQRLEKHAPGKHDQRAHGMKGGTKTLLEHVTAGRLPATSDADKDGSGEPDRKTLKPDGFYLPKLDVPPDTKAETGIGRKVQVPGVGGAVKEAKVVAETHNKITVTFGPGGKEYTYWRGKVTELDGKSAKDTAPDEKDTTPDTLVTPTPKAPAAKIDAPDETPAPASKPDETPEAPEAPEAKVDTTPGAPGEGKVAGSYPASAGFVPPFYVKDYGSPAGTDTVFAEAGKKWAKSLLPDEKEAIKAYQDGLKGSSLMPAPPSYKDWRVGVYQPINRRLRGVYEHDTKWTYGNGKEIVDRYVKAMTDSVDRAIIPEDVVGFRGIRSGGDAAGKFKEFYDVFKTGTFDTWEVGKRYTKETGGVDKGMLSTTFSKQKAVASFTKSGTESTYGFAPPPIVLEYRVPKGVKGYAMNAANPASLYSDTLELMLAPNQGYTVVAKYAADDGTLHAVLQLDGPEDA